MFGTARSRPAALEAALQQVSGLTDLLKAEMSRLAAQGKVRLHAVLCTQRLCDGHLPLACMSAETAPASLKISASLVLEARAERHRTVYARLKTLVGLLAMPLQEGHTLLHGI